MTEEVRFILSADDTKANAALKRTEDNLRRVGSATAYTKQQMQNLSFQMTDIVAGLATGQSPFYVLLQQGGQLKDTFGGVGGAVKAVASVFTLARVAAFGMVGGLAAVGVATVQAYTEQREFDKSLALTGNVAGQTADSYRAMAQKVAESANVTISAAKELTQGAISSGAFGPRAMAQAAEAMARVQKLSGETSAEVIKRFAGMQNGVAKWAAESNRAYNFLTVEQFKYIQRLEKQGDADTAAVEALRLLNTELGVRMPTNLGLAERGWESLGKAASAAWSAMGGAVLGVGRQETIAERVDRLRNEFAVASTRGGGPITDASRARRQPGIEGDLNTANRDLLRQSEAVTMKAYAALAIQKGIADAQVTPKTFDQLYPRANVSGIIGSASAGSRFRQNEAGSADSIDAALQERNQAAYDAEKERVEQMEKIQLEYSAWWGEQQALMVELAKPEWQRLVESWEDTTSKMQEVGKQFTDGFVDAGRDAFAEFMRTGRLSMEGFRGLVIQTLTQLVYDRVIAKQMGELGNMLWNYIAQGMSGGGFGFGGGGTADPNIGPPELATGTNYVPYDGFPAILHRGEAVVPAKYNPAAGGRGAPSIVINQTLNIGSGVGRSEFVAGMRAAKDAAVGAVRGEVVRGGRLWDR